MDEKRNQILETMRTQLSERGIEGNKVQLDATLAQDLGLDSLDTVEMTLGLEESFGIEIPDSDLENVATVGDAVDLIQRKLAVGA
ncbi:MAG: acyl carrier protein [Actinomycetota bacterium]|nr:acyl carrier protein [Actinomycetota bacterium]